MRRTSLPALVLPFIAAIAGCPLLFSANDPTFACASDADCATAAGYVCELTKQLCVPAGTEVTLEPDPSPDAGPDADPDPDPDPGDGGVGDGGPAPPCLADWADSGSAWRQRLTLTPALGGLIRLPLPRLEARRLEAAAGGPIDRLRVFIDGVERPRRLVRDLTAEPLIDISLGPNAQSIVTIDLHVGGAGSAPADDQRAIYPWFEDFEDAALGAPDPDRVIGRPTDRWTVIEEGGERFLRAEGDGVQTAELVGATLGQGFFEGRVRLRTLTDNHAGLAVGAADLTPADLNTNVAALGADLQAHALVRYDQGDVSVLQSADFGPAQPLQLVTDRWYDLRVVRGPSPGRLILFVDGVQRGFLEGVDHPGESLGLFARSASVDFDDLRVIPETSANTVVTRFDVEPRCNNTPGFCGDGVTDGELGEACDDGDLVPGDGCRPDCQLGVVVPAPVARWPLDITGVGMAFDIEGSADGTLFGTWPGRDAQRGFRRFDGDDHIDVGQPAALDISGDITIAVWVRAPSGEGLQNLVARGHRFNPNHEIQLRINDGQFQGGYWNGDNNLASTTIAPDELNRWVHLAVTHIDDEWRLFVDGVLRDSNPGLGVETFNARWAIGRRGASAQSNDPRLFAGDLSDVRLYDVGLTDAEIAALAAGAE